MKEFLSLGGGGGAGMFSLTEWIMKGVVWSVLLLFVSLGLRRDYVNELLKRVWYSVSQ
jgi:hypothetical protein